MLIIHGICQSQLQETRKFADEHGLREDLESRLRYLSQYACQDDPENTQCHLYPDHAPLSFQFVMKTKSQGNPQEYIDWFAGGLIYEGPDQPLDGSAPAFTVSTGQPRHGWSVHT